MNSWHGVPLEHLSKWRLAFDEHSGVHVASPCPVCGASELKRFFGSAAPLENVRSGYIGKGASWEWCTACKAYEHASCLVPTWWAPIKIESEEILTAEPGKLEEQLKAAGYA